MPFQGLEQTTSSTGGLIQVASRLSVVAGDWARKTTLTFFLHTFFPFETRKQKYLSQPPMTKVKRESLLKINSSYVSFL